MDAKKILLVEGLDDEHVLKNLCGARKVGKLDEFKKFEGVDRLLRELPVELKGSNTDALGVVIDADVNPAGEQRFSDAAKPKAVIHTWLAWQKEPGKPMGTAITARFLDPDAPQVDTLIQWLQRLYFSNS